MILLNPGPVTLSAGVRRALSGPDLCHREPEFAELQASIRKRLLAVYGLQTQQWAAILLSGSGTAAVEAMVSSLVPESGKLLIVENGVYGERMTRIAHIHGLDHASYRLEWGEKIDLKTFAGHLHQEKPTHVAVVHHETTTGRLNDIAGIAQVCGEYYAQLLVDAVSSFGAEAIDFSQANIAACAATANKCLHATPGAAFVITRRAALDSACVRSVYLDLAGYCRAQDANGTPFTPSIPSFYALEQALVEHEKQGGLKARHAHYLRLAEWVAQGLAELGIEPLLPGQDCSVVLRGYRLPADLSYQPLHDGLKAQGFIIYAGQGEFAKHIFRVSTMGEITEADMHRFLDGVSELLKART